MIPKKTIQIPAALYDDVAKRAAEAGYDSPDEFVAFLCRASGLTRADAPAPSPMRSAKLDPEAEKRLKQLGYR